MRRLPILIGAMLVLTVTAAPAAADGGGVSLRAFGAWMDSSLDETVPSDDGTPVHVGSSSDIGFGAALEYGFNHRVGVEFGVLSASPGVKLNTDIPGFGALAVEDALSTTALTLDLNLYLTAEDSPVDFFVGVGAASVSFGSLRYTVMNQEVLSLRVGDDTSWTVKAGLDFRFGDSGWGLTAGLRHIDAEINVIEEGDEPGDNQRFSHDLLVATVGVVYGFQ